ncbi:MAG TPA: diaminopimelate epimerase [Streptosporangiaceae bacterium]|jgi:diaminopimelate epimerase
MRFAKGHGTGNDFVILPDPDGRLDLSALAVARICDRHAGLGADGILRVVRSAAAGPGAGRWARQAAEQGAEWFMDYRNADGSVAEMCGNGIRVFVRYLLDNGLATGPAPAVGTRAGVRVVSQAPGGDLTAQMGPARVTGTGSARLGDRSCAGLSISVGNPHLACLVDEPVADFDLTRPPALEAGQFPAGANVEVLRLTGDRRVEMRVYERGSGATLSCGTGAVAAAVGAAVAAGEWPAQEGSAQAWIVDVPGGRLTVTPSATDSLLTGPAVIIAAGELDDAWLRQASGDEMAAALSGIA